MCRADGFLLRADWLENLNIDYTEGDFMTLDEFYDVLYAFTYGDPDGNGVDDTWGLKSYAFASGALMNGMSRIFHIGNGWYEMPDGTYTYLKHSRDYDYYKQYLAFANKCWEGGVMEPDTFALDGAASMERNSQYGCIAEYPGNMDNILPSESEGRFVYLPGVTLENDPLGGYTYGDQNTGIWGYYAISSTCEHPEKVLELADYVLSDEQWGNLNARNLENVGFTVDAEGNYDFSAYKEIQESDKANGTDLANVALIGSFLRRSDAAEFFINKEKSPEERKRIAKLIDMTFELYWPTVDRGYKPETESDPVLIEYGNFMIQEEAKIITGDKPVSYWDELLDGYYEAGYDEYVEEMLEYISSFQ